MSDNFEHAYAFLIGVGGEGDIKVTVNDAKAIHNILVNPFRAAYKTENVKLLTEETATRDNIIFELNEFVDKVLRLDYPDLATVIIYYSGHGVVRGGQYYFLPYGSDSTKTDQLISFTDFHEILERIRNVRKHITILDCCYAGAYLLDKGAMAPEEVQIELPAKELVKRLHDGVGTVVISSSAYDQKSYIGKGQPNSVFTECLLEVLNGRGISSTTNSLVEIADISRYLRTEVTKRTKFYRPRLQNQELPQPIIEDEIQGEFYICQFNRLLKTTDTIKQTIVSPLTTSVNTIKNWSDGSKGITDEDDKYQPSSYLTLIVTLGSLAILLVGFGYFLPIAKDCLTAEKSCLSNSNSNTSNTGARDNTNASNTQTPTPTKTSVQDIVAVPCESNNPELNRKDYLVVNIQPVQSKELKSILDKDFSPSVYLLSKGIKTLERHYIKCNQIIIEKPNSNEYPKLWINSSPTYQPRPVDLTKEMFEKATLSLELRRIDVSDEKTDAKVEINFITRYAEFGRETGDWETANYATEYIKLLFPLYSSRQQVMRENFLRNLSSFLFSKDGKYKNNNIYYDIISRLYASNSDEISPDFLAEYSSIIGDDSMPLLIRQDTIRTFMSAKKSSSTLYQSVLEEIKKISEDENSPLNRVAKEEINKLTEREKQQNTNK